jgi:hypothetical protein
MKNKVKSKLEKIVFSVLEENPKGIFSSDLTKEVTKRTENMNGLAPTSVRNYLFAIRNTPPESIVVTGERNKSLFILKKYNKDSKGIVSSGINTPEENMENLSKFSGAMEDTFKEGRDNYIDTNITSPQVSIRSLRRIEDLSVIPLESEFIEISKYLGLDLAYLTEPDKLDLIEGTLDFISFKFYKQSNYRITPSLGYRCICRIQYILEEEYSEIISVCVRNDIIYFRNNIKNLLKIKVNENNIQVLKDVEENLNVSNKIITELKQECDKLYLDGVLLT